MMMMATETITTTTEIKKRRGRRRKTEIESVQEIENDEKEKKLNSKEVLVEKIRGKLSYIRAVVRRANLQDIIKKVNKTTNSILQLVHVLKKL